MSSNRLEFALCLLIAVCNLFQYSQQAPAVSIFIKEFDTNGDGKVEIGSEIDKLIGQRAKVGSAEQVDAFVDATLRAVGLENRAGPTELGDNGGALFGASDANGDGRLGVGELAAFMKKFAAANLDNNHDGTVTQAEVEQYDAQESARFFKKYDKNGDQRLSAAEMQAFVDAILIPVIGGELEKSMARVPVKQMPMEKAVQLFGAKYGLKAAQLEPADANHDGLLSMAEFGHKIGMPMAQARLMMQSPQYPFARVISDQMLAEADRNGDGFVNLDEELTGIVTQAMMKMADGNGDGQLDLKEFVRASIDIEKMMTDEKN